jgi:hypothetical protein
VITVTARCRDPSRLRDNGDAVSPIHPDHGGELMLLHRMSPHRTLITASIAMAILWAVGMLWWLPPLTNAGYVVQAIAGAIVGIVWYPGMRVWMACCPTS